MPRSNRRAAGPKSAGFANTAASPKPVTYAQAGVDIDEGDRLVGFLKKINPAIGGFSGAAALPKGMKNPRLLMSTDGVGTKLLIAQLAGLHTTIGIDLVAMVVNDLIVAGGRPLWFLDYFATGRLEGNVARQVLAGIVEGCRQAGCELVGGETAEMPGMYAPGHYDLAGFGVGVVEADRILDGKKVKPGDALIGVASSGAHSNGYSLVRRALLPAGDAAARKALAKTFAPTGRTMAEELLTPTRIYVKAALALMEKVEVRAMAHITGGGIEGNLARVLPKGVIARVRTDAWPKPPIFEEIARRGPVEPAEMFKVFNMGVGLIAVVPAEQADKALATLKRAGETAFGIGEIAKAKDKKADAAVELVAG